MTWNLHLNSATQQDILSDLQFLLTPSRTRHLVGLYFRYWHKNYQMIHLPSYELERTPLPLLAAITFMGAMYSTDERETLAAHRRIDLVELYIFSTETFSSLKAKQCDLSSTSEEASQDHAHFENLQAGTIMVITQYWAGSRSSSNHAMVTRFDEIIQVRLDA